MLPTLPLSRAAYVIFTQTLCEGLVPAWHDESNLPVTYATELEAQREIAEDLMEQLRQFLDGSRDFDDAITNKDFILPVQVWPDGRISTETVASLGNTAETHPSINPMGAGRTFSHFQAGGPPTRPDFG